MATGITTRHALKCAKRRDEGARCNCSPSYRAWIWVKDREHPNGHKVRRAFKTLEEAKEFRRGNGTVEAALDLEPTLPTIREAGEAWLADCDSGKVRKRKGGGRFKPSALRGYR